MDDSVNIKPKSIAESLLRQDNFQEQIDVNSAVNQFVQEIEQTEHLSETTNTLMDIISTELTLYNYETIFKLNNLQATELPPMPEQRIRNIRYKDKEGTTLAIVQIYSHMNKIKLQTFGHILPKQEFTTPQTIVNRILTNAEMHNWETEDGGVNHFDGNIETRYKDKDGNVMAAVITKTDGVTVDTVVEYEYHNGKKTKMLHTNQYGQSMTIYDNAHNTSQIVCIEIDTDGCIYSITKNYSA